MTTENTTPIVNLIRIILKMNYTFEITSIELLQSYIKQ